MAVIVRHRKVPLGFEAILPHSPPVKKEEDRRSVSGSAVTTME